MTRFFILLILFVATYWNAAAATLTLTSQEIYFYIDQNAAEYYSASSPEFFSNLDGDNFGDYGWVIANNSGAAWANLSIFLFLDAEWDLETNLVSNEYGEFLGLGLPVGAPIGAVAPDGWEIDEPGYVFGDIYDNVSTFATVDGFNAVPSSAPDDVSIAYRWTLPALAAGESLRLTVLHESAATTGIGHFDPDSNGAVYVNGYVQLVAAPPIGNEVPEPGTTVALGTGLAVIGYLLRKKGN